MKRRAALRLSDVLPEVLAKLERGVAETTHLIEWLRIDMEVLATNVLTKRSVREWGSQVLHQLPSLSSLGVVRRLETIGTTIASVAGEPSSPFIRYLGGHRSDVVRQWAVYALNSFPEFPLARRLAFTYPFAADGNMSVRECAWMSLRPHVSLDLSTALAELKGWVVDADANVRRCAVEVTRPRSVWGKHIVELKQRPELAIDLLEAVKADPARYVQLSVGNWLNDAYRTRPDWTEKVCRQWSHLSSPTTSRIVRRALRNAKKQQLTARKTPSDMAL